MSVNANYIKAEGLFDADKHKDALKFYDKAIADEPSNPDYYSKRGVTYFHLGNLKAALADMNTSAELEPEYSYRYASRAYIKDAMGDLDGAIEDYKIAVQLDPEDGVAFNNLGLLEEKQGYATAKKHFDKADELGLPGNADAIEPKDGIVLKPRNLQKEHDAKQKELQT
jgi:tetratricopeptide (TPR) repeat protein